VDLPSEHVPDALDRIATWRADPWMVQACPVCQVPGLIIIDRSVRPYSEWYALTCAACGLDGTVHIPLPGPVSI
jgi:hypothetical protein